MSRRLAVAAALALTFAAPVVAVAQDDPGTTSDGTAAAAGRPPRLEVRLKPLRAEIGDPVRAEIELVVPPGLAVGRPIFPRWEKSWGELEVTATVGPTAEPAAGGATLFRQTVTVIPWTTGELTLPSPTIELPTAEEVLEIRAARPVALTVGSVLPEDGEQPTPKPPAMPRPLPIADVFWWTLAAIASACLFVAALVFARHRAALGGDRERVIDPLVALRRELERLDAGDDPLALVAGLSLALRRYLGRRLGFPAAESTTTEVRRRLQDRGLAAGLVLGIDDLLKSCDRVKFARLPIARAECGAPLAEAAQLAERLEEHLRPAPAGEGDQEDDTREAA